MYLIKLFYFFSILSLFITCGNELKNENKGKDSQWIIKMDQAVLYHSDIPNHRTFYTLGSKDSVFFVKKYIENWIYKQFITQKLTKEKEFLNKLIKINKIVENYRLSLLQKEYEEDIIRMKLRDQISQEELLNYYNQHQEDFELNQNILRGSYLKMSLKVGKEKIERAKKYLIDGVSFDNSEYKEFIYLYCAEYINDSMWVDVNFLIQKMPRSFTHNNFWKVKVNSILEETDKNYIQLFKVKEYKMSDEISPFSFVKDKIFDIIINEQSKNILEKQKKMILSNLRKTNSIEVNPSVKKDILSL